MPTEKKSNILGSLLECLDQGDNKGEKNAFPRWLALKSRGRPTVAQRVYEAWSHDPGIIEDDARLWEAINPGLPLHGGELRKARSRLSKHLRDFFSWQQLEQENADNPSSFLQNLLNRKEYGLFEYHYRREIKRLEQKPIRDTAYYETRFGMLTAYQAYLYFQNPLGLSFEIYEDLRRTFGLWESMQNLYLWIMQYNHCHMRKLPLPEPFPEAFWDRLEQWQQEEDLPVFRLYSHIIWLLVGAPKGNLEAALKNFDEVFPYMNAQDAITFFTFLYNMAVIRMVKSPKMAEVKRVLDISRFGLEKKLLFETSGILQISIFKNHIECCLRVEGPASALVEYERYNPYISPLPGAEAARKIALAHIYMEAGRHQDFREISKDFVPENKNDEIRMRLLRLRLDLTMKKEGDEPEIFLSSAQSLQRYLYRLEGFNETLRGRYLMLSSWYVRFIEKYYDAKALENLESEVAEDIAHPFSKWLHGKIVARLEGLS